MRMQKPKLTRMLTPNRGCASPASQPAREEAGRGDGKREQGGKSGEEGEREERRVRRREGDRNRDKGERKETESERKRE